MSPNLWNSKPYIWSSNLQHYITLVQKTPALVSMPTIRVHLTYNHNIFVVKNKPKGLAYLLCSVETMHCLVTRFSINLLSAKQSRHLGGRDGKIDNTCAPVKCCQVVFQCKQIWPETLIDEGNTIIMHAYSRPQQKNTLTIGRTKASPDADEHKTMKSK